MDLILHHYDFSNFAEKARLMLGFKGLAWHAVTQPPILPKPDVTVLTGGYRRTPVIVDLWIGRLGGASIDVCYEVRDEGSDAAVYARSTATIVLVDAATGRPRRITDEQRAVWEPYIEEPIAFQRRH